MHRPKGLTSGLRGPRYSRGEPMVCLSQPAIFTECPERFAITVLGDVRVWLEKHSKASCPHPLPTSYNSQSVWGLFDCCTTQPSNCGCSWPTLSGLRDPTPSIPASRKSKKAPSKMTLPASNHHSVQD